MQDIITPQVEPTPWVGSLSYPFKSNGTLWLCLDPKDLNKAIIYEHHKAIRRDHTKVRRLNISSTLDTKMVLELTPHIPQLCSLYLTPNQEDIS